jgi:predicted transcriptional regulator
MKTAIPKSISAFLNRQEKAGRKFEKFQPRPYQWLSKSAPPALDDFTDANGAYEAAHKLSNLYGKMEVLAFEEGETIPTHLVGLHGEGVIEPSTDGAMIGEALRNVFKKYDHLEDDINNENEENSMEEDESETVKDQ